MVYFQILIVVINTAMHIEVHIVFWTDVLEFLEYIPRSGIAGSKDSYAFFLLRELYIVFHSGCTSLHSRQ